ncbi:MAG: hypothetical protein K0S35_754 [Geminicoccaceae bacterium]|jgi:hypothetical protein|nr:hypothetical protein [Geminicoccaceae bacterium]
MKESVDIIATMEITGVRYSDLIVRVMPTCTIVLERTVGRLALELEFLRGRQQAQRGREARLRPSSLSPRPLRHKDAG